MIDPSVRTMTTNEANHRIEEIASKRVSQFRNEFIKAASSIFLSKASRSCRRSRTSEWP